MAIKRGGAVVRQVSTLFNVGVIRDLTDGQLLERFANGQGEAAELAFAALVDRHGPMVLRVCRARLSDPHDALDAFQATFLILIEKAPGLWVRDSLGPWLHAVALRTATRARSATARRRRVERLAAERSIDQDADRGWEQALHEEIDRLPERYRVPIVLCDLEGRTCEEAARKMGRPVGTVKSWRARARERLRQRLTRAGLAPSVGLTAVTTPEMNEAIRAVMARMTAGTVPASVGVLVKGVLKAMFIKKLGTAAAMVGALAFAAAGAGSLARVAADDPEPPRPEARIQPAPAPPRKPDDETRPLSLREAIRMGLENWAEVRTVEAGTPPDDTLVIAPMQPGKEAFQFESLVVSHVQSIEQRYWGLSQKYVQLWAAEKAVEIAGEVLKQEPKAGTEAEVKEANRRLDQFNLGLVGRTSEAITSERWLRDVLGLAPAGSRRIVPVTPPAEAKIEPDWDECLAAMKAKNPGVVHTIRAATVAHAMRNDPARGDLETVLGMVVKEPTHRLEIAFREIEAYYERFQAAKRVRVTARERLATQRARYDEGRITIDACLDAVSQYARAVTEEAQFKAAYNIAIVDLEAAKGTLLERYEITLPTPDVAQRPRVIKAPASADPEAPR